MGTIAINRLCRCSTKLLNFANADAISLSFSVKFHSQLHSANHLLRRLHSVAYSTHYCTVDICLFQVRKQAYFTVRNSRCGKVMFMGGVHPPRQTPHPQADTPLSRHPLGQTPPGRHPPPSDDHCSGRYASYWNAFLFTHTCIFSSALLSFLQIISILSSKNP